MSKEIILLTPRGMIPIHTEVFEKLKKDEKDEKLVISELSIEQSLEKQKQLEEQALRKFEYALVFTKPPQIYLENPNGMTNRQRRKHEETRKRKGRK